MVFDIVGDKITVTAETLSVPEFKALWDRDKSKDKSQALNELKYVTFLCDMSMSNPYRGYSEVDKESILRADMFNENWVPDSLVHKAIEKFDQLQVSTNSRMLKGAKKAADQLAKYFETIDFTKVDANGKAYSAKDLASNLKDVGSIIKSLSSLEEQVLREQLDSSRIRGGSEIGEFELPD